MRDFEKTDAGGKPVSLVGWSSPFYSRKYCGGYCGFVTDLFSAVRSRGAIPFITWGSDDLDHTSDPDFTDAAVVRGSQDSYIRGWALAAKAWGRPFFLRFDPEMNGNWSPWSPGLDRNTAASYVAMWIHVHKIFTSVGAANVTWVWCPNVDPSGQWASLASLYPGNSYVNWTCTDVYNGDHPWRSFRSLFDWTYQEITGTIAPGKPMIIGEVASTGSGGSKARWITDMLDVLPAFRHLGGFLWWDSRTPGPGGHTDWPIESGRAAKAAFARGIWSPEYLSNNFARLEASPIPPPSR